MSLTNTSVLITGASRGLGRALALSLAGRGARLVLVARHEHDLVSTKKQIRDAGGEAHVIAADVGDKDSIYAIAGQAAALVGPIDVLINNASTLGPTPLRDLLDTECEDLQQVLEVNLLGPFRLIKAVAGSMALRRRGLVINISSDASVEAYATWGAYGVSKAALDHLTRIWSQELAEQGVDFLAIDPGEMDTEMHRAAIPEADVSTLAKPEAVASHIARMIENPAPVAPVRQSVRL